MCGKYRLGIGLITLFLSLLALDLYYRYLRYSDRIAASGDDKFCENCLCNPIALHISNGTFPLDIDTYEVCGCQMDSHTTGEDPGCIVWKRTNNSSDFILQDSKDGKSKDVKCKCSEQLKLESTTSEGKVFNCST